MNAYIFIIFFIIFITNPFSLRAEASHNEDVSWCTKVRNAYFRPSDKKVRKIYSNGWADYQLELSKIFLIATVKFGVVSVGLEPLDIHFLVEVKKFQEIKPVYASSR
jgi:hypothetical protein